MSFTKKNCRFPIVRIFVVFLLPYLAITFTVYKARAETIFERNGVKVYTEADAKGYDNVLAVSVRGQNDRAMLEISCFDKRDLIAVLWLDLKEFGAHSGVVTYQTDNMDRFKQRGFVIRFASHHTSHRAHFLIEPDHSRAVRKASLPFMRSIWGKNQLSFTYTYKNAIIDEIFDLSVMQEGWLEKVVSDCDRLTDVSIK